MKLITAKSALIASILFVPIVLMAIHSGGNSGNLAMKAMSNDSATAEKAIGELRVLGPQGIELFLAAHEDDFQKKSRQEIMTLHHSLDLIAGQKDAYYSRLYWYNDLEKAKSAARITKKPILSLRMLGKLTDDLSCANSRLFRTTLYANQSVASHLRENFILHWSAERPVPVVTIDYGDGRVLKRTLTGNSIHYVLTPEGKPIEAIPGLYTPNEFLNRLKEAEALFALVNEKNEADARREIIKFHQNRRMILAKFAQSKNIIVGSAPFVELPDITAMQPQYLTVGKRRIETPLLLEIEDLNPAKFKRNAPQPSEKDRGPSLNPWENIKGENIGGENPWIELAEELNYIMEFDSSSLSLIREKNILKYADQAALEIDLNALKEGTPVETIRNEILLHLQLHDWFVQNDYQEAFSDLNTNVYAELFLTPRSDKWLGLLPADVFSGIDGDGIISN